MKYTLLKREEKQHKGKVFFFEKWVEPESKSGIVFYSSVRPDGNRYYVVEGYGIGTIDPKTFTEIADIAPIQRSEYRSLQAGRKGLAKLMRENLEIIKNR